MNCAKYFPIRFVCQYFLQTIYNFLCRPLFVSAQVFSYSAAPNAGLTIVDTEAVRKAASGR